MFPATLSVSALFRLEQRDLRCLFAATTTVILDLEGDLVALFQGRYPRALQPRGMDKDVLLATFRRDEAEAAHGIKKFNCAIEANGIVLSRKVSLNGPRGPLRSLGVSKYRERDVLVVGAMSCRQSKSAPTIGCAVDHLYGRCHINKQAQSSKEAGLTVCRHAKYNVRFGSLADIGVGDQGCPLYPQKRTFVSAARLPISVCRVAQALAFAPLKPLMRRPCSLPG